MLLLGAGPDALPVHEFAVRLGWKVTLYDHRLAALLAAFRRGLWCGAARAIGGDAVLSQFDAAVVMSHHLPPIWRICACWPSHRSAMSAAGAGAASRNALGTGRAGHTPSRGDALAGGTGYRRSQQSSIALAIVAEIHAWLHGRAGGPFSGASIGAAPLPQSLSTA
jgi:xanthine/CO dehydrogenase XdhC/CoxF family maturation factor